VAARTGTGTLHLKGQADELTGNGGCMKDSIIDNLENLRILITDDDLFMLRALEKVLTSIGFENIVTVGDGNEAWRR
jgi:PleD family two-component response regulator